MKTITFEKFAMFVKKGNCFFINDDKENIFKQRTELDQTNNQILGFSFKGGTIRYGIVCEYAPSFEILKEDNKIIKISNGIPLVAIRINDYINNKRKLIKNTKFYTLSFQIQKINQPFFENEAMHGGFFV